MIQKVNSFKDEKYSALLTKFAAEYFLNESNGESLITITYTEILDRGKKANVYFTVLPESKEQAVLEFAKRKRRDFRQYIMSKKSFGFAPQIDFFVDMGERNRQRIDELIAKG